MNTKKAVLGFAPRETARENPDPTAKLDRDDSQRKSTRRRPRAPGDDIAQVLAADLADVFGREAPEVSLAALGQAIILEAQRREAQP